MKPRPPVPVHGLWPVLILWALAICVGCDARVETEPTEPTPELVAVDPVPALSADAAKALGAATHLVVVVTGDWTAPTGDLTLWVRGDDGWIVEQGPYPAAVGRSGLSWGRGLSEPPAGAERVKQEGDGSAPAGLFRLGTSMGYAATPPEGLSLPYRQAGASTVCVDDKASAAYNRITVTPDEGEPGWSSKENMLRDDHLYRLLALVDHNGLVSEQGTVAGGGSCIFLHVWREAGSPTAGCTALDEAKLRALLVALPAEEGALLVQLPRSAYEQLEEPWGLPPLPGGV